MEGAETKKEQTKKGKKRDIVKMSFPLERIEDAVGSYRYSKIYTSSYTHFPNDDEWSHQTSMNKIFALRQLDMAEKRLAAKRVEANETGKKFDQRWVELHDGLRNLKDNFLKFDGFLKANLEKRDRATKRIQEEITMQDERKEILKTLKYQLEFYQKIQIMMVKKIKEYRIYEDYLTKVVAVSMDFKNVPAVLNRFQDLIEAKDTSTRKHEEEVMALETARAQMSKLMEEKFTALLGLRSTYGNLNSRYESARVNALAWESTLQEVKQHILHVHRESKSVIRAGKQLHKMMCQRQNTAPKTLDFEERLQFIKHTLTQLHWLRHVKFADIRETDNQLNDSRPPAKTMMKQATDQEQRVVKQMGKSRLSLFAYLLSNKKMKKPVKRCSKRKNNS